MNDGRGPSDGRRDEAVGVLDSQTPYQLTLKGLLFPWPFQFGLNAFAGVSLALIGAPLLALGWTLASCAADYRLQRLYAHWWTKAEATDSTRGLRRLTVCVLLRSSLWLAAPVALTLATHTPAARGYTALTALSMVALAVSCGWISRGVWMGIAAPPVVAVVIEVLPHSEPTQTVGLVSGRRSRDIHRPALVN